MTNGERLALAVILLHSVSANLRAQTDADFADLVSWIGGVIFASYLALSALYRMTKDDA